jgi:hypothetical protein
MLTLHNWTILVLAILAGAIAASTGAQTAHVAPRHKKFSREIPMGASRSSIGNTCFIISSRVSAANFFDGLEVTRTQTEAEFQKDSQRVMEFPEVLKSKLRFLITKCSEKTLETQDASRDFLEHLTFKVKWKRGLDTRPVRQFSSIIRKPTSSDLSEQIEGLADDNSDLAV